MRPANPVSPLPLDGAEPEKGLTRHGNDSESWLDETRIKMRSNIVLLAPGVISSFDLGTGTMTEKHTTDLSLKLLGGFDLSDRSGARIKLPTRNARALLAYLAIQPGQSQPREKLKALLWGDRSEKQARHSLNQTLLSIRKAVKRAGREILDSDRESVTFVPGSIDVDVSTFRERAVDRPSEAMDLYDGPFLDGIGIREANFEDWLSAQRSDLHALACKALKGQRERCVRAGRYAEGIEAGQRLVALDPLNEDAHRQLMRLYHELGERMSALKQYLLCVEILERELDVDPTSETTRLYEEIKGGSKGSDRERQNDDRPYIYGAGAGSVPGVGNKPSIAVLPFDNMSDDPKQAYFSDGVTEDIVTELSRYSDFFVIARNATFAYKHKTPDHRQVARDLGAQFMLAGSVRTAEKNVRVSAQLVDTSTGSQVWAERFDRALSNLFVVQTEISGLIVSRLADTIRAEGIRQASHKHPNSLGAYDKCLQAWGHPVFHDRAGKKNNAEARRLTKEAISLDPGYSRAYAMLARTYLLDFTSLWADDPDHALKCAYEAARKAVSLDGSSFYAHQSLGMSQVWLGHHDSAMASMRRAIELNPNDADARAHLANILVFAGRPEDALKELKAAMRLNPTYPEWYLQHQGRAYFTQRRYRQAESNFERVVAVNPGWPWAHLILAATRAALGKAEEAKAEVDEARKISPAITLVHVPRAWPFRRAMDLGHVVGLMRKAGLTE